MTLTREEVRLGFLYAFGREPETEDLYQVYQQQQSVLEFRALLFGSEEGQDKLRQLKKSSGKHLSESFERPAICFLHMEKTGGTTFHYVLANYFPPERVSAPHIFRPDELALSELAGYDLISGHFDFFTSQFIPRRRVARISIFRDPVDRLISLYRFLRSHPPYIRPGHPYMELAARLGPAEFFRDPQVLASRRFNNNYLHVFGTTLAGPTNPLEDSRNIDANLTVASQRVRSLAGIGLTHRMRQSVDLILPQFGLTPPSSFETRHETDVFAEKVKGFVAVPKVEMTPAVEQALAPLVRFDTVVYRVASETFEARLAQAAASAGPNGGRGGRESAVS